MPTPEALFHHGKTQTKVGVLLINLGTPAQPTKASVKAYLKEFLSDKRVIELPKWLWWIILNSLVLAIRPKKSTKKYQSIWLPEGSPLAIYTQKQTELLRNQLEALQISNIVVDYAMRYGAPSIAEVISKMQQQNVTKLIVLPLYPQYASSSSGTALEKVFQCISQQRHIMDVRTIKNFHDHPAYIKALALSIEQHWQAHGKAEKLLFSFHGVPLKTLEQGDPYFCECHKSARLIAEQLELSKDDYIVAFQSRFGKAKWVEPATQTTLQELPKKGIRHLDVICPGFVSDCLETLEEIAIEGKEIFMNAGGKQFNYIPCLNGQDFGVTALQEIIIPHLSNWNVQTISEKDLIKRQKNKQCFGTSL